MSGDVNISNTGAATIQADAVALGTDTTGNYVATITAGSGISGSSSTEGGTPTIALGALTADWNQTGAFDLVLNNTSSELKILEGGGTPTLFGIFDIADLSSTDKTYTFPDLSGTVALTANTLGVFAATTSAQLAAVISDETGTGLLVYSAGPTFTGDPLAPTPTTGDNDTSIATTAFVKNQAYLTAEADTLASVTGRGATTATASSFTGGATIRSLTVDTATGTDDRILITAATGGAARFDGSLTNADLTAARTWTFPNVSGTVVTTGNLTDITATGTITSGTWNGTTIAVANGGTGATTLTSNGVLYGNGTGAIQATAAGTSAQFLVANGSGVPVFVSMSGDVNISNTGAATIQADAVALGTDTTGNYVATVTTSALTGLTGGAAGSEGTAITLGLDYSATLAANPVLATGNSVFGTTGLIFEGATADTFETLLTPTDPTADNTFTLPNVSGTIITTGNLSDITATGTITSGTWNGTAIGAQYGGTGINTSASTGIPTISSGTWSVSSSLSIALGGTNATTIGSAGSVAYSNGSAYAFSAVGTAGQAMVSGGAGAPTWFAPTLGSVIFAGASGILSQDNANYFWDDTNNRLGLGTTSPAAMLSLYGTTNAMRLSYDGSNYNTLSTTSTGELSITGTGTDAQILVGDGSAIDTSVAFDGSSTDFFSGIDTTTGSYMIGSGFIVQAASAFLTVNSTGLIGVNMTPAARFDVTHASTSTTAGTEYSLRNAFSDTGIVTSGTDTTYGGYTSVTRTGATGGTINTYGQYTLLSTDTAGAGTSTAYGSYIDTNVAGSANADTVYGQYINTESNAGTTYGLYVDAGTGAGTEYSAIFMNGAIGIGDTTPDARLDIDFAQTSGTLYRAAAPSSVTLAGTLTGLALDLSTNVTSTGQSVTGETIALPAVTNTAAATYNYLGLSLTSGNYSNTTNAATTNIKGVTYTTGTLTNSTTGTQTEIGYGVIGGAITQNTAAGTVNFHGVNVANPNITQTTGTVTASGMTVTTGSITTGGTQNGLNIVASGVGVGSLNGLNISAITAGAGTETALKIGSGWDTLLDSATLDISGAGAITGATGITSSGSITFSAFTSGSVPFFGTGGLLSQDNANYFWDDTNNRLGIGTATPAAMLSLYGTTNAMRLSYDGSNYNTLSTTSAGDFSLVSSNTSESQVVIGNGGSVDTSVAFDGASTDFFSGIDTTTGSYMIGSGFTVQSANAFLTVTSAGNVTVNTGQLDASADGVVTKVTAGACNDTTFAADTNGNICVDSTNGRMYFRYGGAWHYVNQTAGFQIPNYETAPQAKLDGEALADQENALPFDATSHPEYLTKAMQSGEFLIPYVDEYLSDGAVHGLYARFDDVKSKMFGEEQAQIATLTLKTDQSATTLSGLQDSIDTELLAVSGELSRLSDENESEDTAILATQTDIAAIQAGIVTIQTDANTLAARTATVEADLTTVKTQIDTLTEFFSTFDLGNVIAKDVNGDVDLIDGTLAARIIETGGIVVRNTVEDAPTIGTVEILPVAVDVDTDGNDDITGLPMTADEVVARDGQTAQVMTRAMIPMINGSRIFTGFKGNPNGFSWIEKTVVEGDYVGFTIHVSQPVVAPVKVDWWLIEQK